MDLDAFVNKLFDESRFTSPEKLKAALPEGFARLRQDPVVKLYNTVYETLMKLSAETSAGDEKIAKGSKSFAAGLMEWKKKEPSYPDANSTMRLTYGTVKSYSPQDALTYRYYSTIYGVIEKEDPDNYEFGSLKTEGVVRRPRLRTLRHGGRQSARVFPDQQRHHRR